jgi:hypothetical protein
MLTLVAIKLLLASILCYGFGELLTRLVVRYWP